MKLRTSFFNPTVLKKDITRFFPLWGLLLIFKVLSFSVNSDSAGYLASTVAESMRTLGIGQFFYGSICALLLFGGLFHARTAGTLHALPLRREGWFLTHLVAGVCLYLLPNVPEALLYMLGLWELWYLALLRLVVGLVMFLFFFGIGAFSCQCAGTRLGALAVHMLINFFSLLILFVLDTFYRPMLPGILMDNELALLLCPVIAFTEGCFVVVETTYHQGNYYNSLSEWVSEFRGFVGNDWLQLLIAFGIGLVFLGGALLLYRRRQIESAGDFISARFMAPIFLVLYSFLIGTVLYLIGGKSYIFLMVGIAIGFFTGLMLLHKKVNVFRKKAWLSLGVLIVVFLATLGITKLDPFGVVNYVPSASQVEQVSISTGYYYAYSMPSNYDLETQVVLDTPEELAQAEELHRLLLQENADSVREFQLIYKLKDGRTVKRQYSYTGNSKISKLMRPLLSRLDLFEDTEILKNAVSVYYDYDSDLILPDSTPSVHIVNPTHYGNDFHFSAATSVQHTVTGSMDQDAMALGLWAAIWQDCLEGHMAQDWEYHSQRDGELEIEYLNEDGKIETKYFSVFTDCAHTIDYLKSLKTEEPTVQAPKQYCTMEDFSSVEIGETTLADLNELFQSLPGETLTATSYGAFCDFPTQNGGYIRIEFHGPDLIAFSVEEFTKSEGVSVVPEP